MSKKVFLYSDDAADKDARAAFKAKGYELVPLTADKKGFWSGVEKVENNGHFVLLSHGDKNGPLMVKGTEGSDMTDADIKTLCDILIGKKATFYCLSCHTGLDPFAGKMAKTSCLFVAPKGFAVAESSSAGVNVYSKEDGKYPGWSGSGSLVPNRATKPLNIP